MKTRIISAIIGLIVLFVILAFFDTIVLNIAIAIISVMAVCEMFHATKSNTNKLLTFFCLLIAGAIPFYNYYDIKTILPLISYILILALFSIMLIFHKKITFASVAQSFIFTLLIPSTLTIFINFRDLNSNFNGLYYILLSLGAAWLTDSGAYFVGVTMGKHKLCPEISPKKTVEGAIGGILTCEISLLLLSFIYSKIMAYLGLIVDINYIIIGISAPFLSVLSMLGDLTASAIKREYLVKDYGNIMPGHGGVMDRFDSVLMVIPALYFITKFFPFVA